MPATTPPAVHAAPAPESASPQFFALNKIVIQYGDQSASTKVGIPCVINIAQLEQIVVSMPSRTGTLVLPCDGKTHSLIPTDDVPATEPPSAPAAHGK